MSGCHYVGCGCMCHITGIKSILTVIPPKPCCPCDESSKPVSPMIEHMQKLEERIKKADELLRFDHDMRIQKLEDKTEMMRDTAACIDQAYDKACEDLDKRLNHLEVWTSEQIKELEDFRKQQVDWCMDKQELLKVIDSQVTELKQQYEALICQIPDEIDVRMGSQKPKMPYKCPVCDGLGLATLFRQTKCNACQGNGIIWA